MRQDSSALQFSPQIAALAMPGESVFTKAAEGIGNLGKVFQDQQDREQQQQLRDLQVQGAQEDLQSKQFANSIAGDEWDIKKQNYTQERKKNQFDALVKEQDYNAKVKAAKESGFMDEFKKIVPSSEFADPKTGRFSESLYQAKRNEFAGANNWASNNIHLFDALADSYRKEGMDRYKTQAGIDKDVATAKKTNLEATTVIPESNAKVAAQQSVVTKNNAAAHLDNVNADLAPKKADAYVEQTKNAGKNTKIEADKLKKDRQQIVSNDKLGSMVPGWDSYDDASKRFIINKYIEDGMLPQSNREVVVKKGVFSDTTRIQPIYPAGSLDKGTGAATAKPVPKPSAQSKPAQPKPSKSAGGSDVQEGTVIQNKEGQKMVLQNGEWVPTN